ncbi:MAG: hypothetical protein J5696_02820 [Lachnospiraceae bacterium]|nr:hypothetical protein [Lachnospiraceae bacterium]
MMIVKQMDIRANIKKYFDLAYSGEAIFVPRIDNKNVVIISEAEYNRIRQADRLKTYAASIIARSSVEKEVIPYASDLKSDNLKKLEIIRGLKPNWNGNGAKTIPGKLIDKVSNVIKNLSIQPEVFPTAQGKIQLEFDNSRKDHIEISIDESDFAELFCSTYDGKEYTDTISSAPKDINNTVTAFYR